ncbi:MAG: Transcriptional regulator, XRE family [Microgenomates group bacterium Gr01-1014_7]|nr:MAG: Transcriptional regulator, XRE family [Microgenomates group bacterium Gr01-1014_7]
MRTVGQVLKEERERKFYTLDEIEKVTRIRKELLEALEKGEYQKLPPPTFIQGFIKNYGKFLGLNTEKLLAIFRREFSEGKNPPRIMESFANPLDKKRFKITPTRVLVSVVLALIITFFVYLWFQYRFLVGSPFLEVTQPVDQFSTIQEEIVISGRTDPEAKVSINNQEIQVDQNGKFSQQIKLADNASTIVISAVSGSGKQTKIQRTVFLKR